MIKTAFVEALLLNEYTPEFTMSSPLALNELYHRAASHGGRGARCCLLLLLHLLLQHVHIFKLVYQLLHGRPLLKVGPQDQVCTPVRAQVPPIRVYVLGSREQYLVIAAPLLLFFVVC